MKRGRNAGFTLIEVLLTISIIAALSALVIGATAGAHQSAARRRAMAEIASIEAAVEHYRDQNGGVPQVNTTLGSPYEMSGSGDQGYTEASRLLFESLVPAEGKSFIPNKINDPAVDTEMLTDPWGNPYGYNSSTNLTANPRYPGVAIWSTGGDAGNSRTNRWITNWN